MFHKASRFRHRLPDKWDCRAYRSVDLRWKYLTARGEYPARRVRDQEGARATGARGQQLNAAV